MFQGKAVTSTSSQVAKQVVRLAMLEMVGALGQMVDADEPNSKSVLSLDDGKQRSGFMQPLRGCVVLEWC